MALDLAEKIFGDNLARQTVLVIGAGQVSETTLRHLRKRGAQSILISNRSVERASELASQFNGEVFSFEDLAQALDRSDLVISSTSALHHLLTKQELETVMSSRSHRPLLLIDLAVPRDIEPGVQELDGVYLYNIDQLADLARQNLQQRQAEATECEKLVSKEAREFVNRFLPESLQSRSADLISELIATGAHYCPCPRPA